MTKKKKVDPIEEFIIEITEEANVLVGEYDTKHQELRDIWTRILMLSGKQQGLIEYREKMETLEKKVE